MTITIKPKNGYLGTKEIFDNGAIVGEFDFDRTRARFSRSGLPTRGEIRWADGRVVDISGYAFYKDVCDHIRAGALK